MDMPFMAEAFVSLLRGLPLTLNLAAVSMVAASILAIGLAWLRMSDVAPARATAIGYVSFFRGTPLLVQIFLIYYGLGQFRPTLQAWGLWPFLREPYWCALLALTLNAAAYASEVVRGGLLSVPAAQVEAARAVGMSGLLLYRRIIIPIALRQALPAYGSEIIIMIKSTSLASVITMMEVTGLAAKLIAESFRVIEVFVMAGAIYLAINFMVAQTIAAVERWLSPHLRAAPGSILPSEIAHV
ncbi:ABC transporter permease [Bosea lathyri]|uniref:Amino acid ABC transporter membrane protein 2, PAAT family n=1 Tax=Bosea lathyri TaxID=1036778 RepID=A0A1H6DAK4_9HYPH|nr:ABC transporter permease subunit [Bosea lathyri]SEG81873.1 amino acid ABC transporter membrane protein 2, PAAT family [Bosea lathyri]